MNPKPTKSSALILLFITTLFAQPGLYMPLNIKKAYDNGTRSYEGRPGPKYWTNHADYTIKARLRPESRRISGEEAIIYYNNSPDTLRQIVLRLYQDIFRSGNPHDWPINSADITEGVELKAISINGRPLDLKAQKPAFRRSATNLFIKLKNALLPQNKLTLHFKWTFTLPSKSNLRMGTYDSTSFFVGYWYPQIAVYDDIAGWDRYIYSGLQEFYNDCNNFDVTIRVPKGFMVWASGIWQNPQEILTKKYLKRYIMATTTNKIMHVIGTGDKNIFKHEEPNWHFIAKQVPDFAFASSDHYLWDMTSLIVDPAAKRRVVISAAYKKESAAFKEALQIARASAAFYSTEMPAVPFPYPRLTVFNGGGGMEYPMMVNEGAPSKHAGMVHVTSHEILHSYFPFFMGINEQKYAWMDEGWAQMLPFEIQHRLAPKYDPIARTLKRYEKVAGSEFDVPEAVPSIAFGPNAFRPSYRNSSYNRSAMAYYNLEQLLGKKKFVRALQEYIHRWHHKHPIPFDFFFTMNAVANQDLSWFFKPWFWEYGYPDLAVAEAKLSDDTITITVVKKGSIPVPIRLTIQFADGTNKTITESAGIWKGNWKSYTIKEVVAKKVAKVILGGPHIPDVNKKDNIFIF